MSPDIPKQSSAASPWAASWIVAAILLVLNWTVPGAFQTPASVDLGDPAPGISAAERAAKPGTLPRLLSRSSGWETSLPKSPQRRWSAGGKPHALLPQVRVVMPANMPSVAPSVSGTVPSIRATRVFDPRAPPALTA